MSIRDTMINQKPYNCIIFSNLMLTKEEQEEIKEQLLENLHNFPEDKRELVRQKILSMSEQELEEFVKQNQLMSQCIFCSIIQGKSPSYKVAENSDAVAVLEINPVSEGHILAISREHLSEIPQSLRDFSLKIKEVLLKKLNPKEIKISETKIIGHPIIEIIPVYENQKLEKRKALDEELKRVQKKIILKETGSEKKEENEEKSEKSQKEEKEQEKPKLIPKIKLRIP